ncbi:MAG: hypothetical protein M0R66_03000 [Candidatus Omnitrophica bacterium]|jgi:hypothetical protein|nr:hypothetical protein [Candidatus Omnitrophota bacterium]
MATVEIFADSSGTQHAYSQVSRLDGADYLITLLWNTRTEHWTISLETAAGVSVLSGRVVSCGVNLLRGSTVTGRPPGALVAVPLDRSIEHPGLTDLGARVRLWYVEAAA